MELYHLRTFLTVADLQSVTKAAACLATTPPSVSAHIKTLEVELNLSLFVRTPRGMSLTPEGQLLRSHAERVVQEVDRLLHAVAGLQGQLLGELKLGVNATASCLKLPQTITEIQRRHPAIQLTLLTSSTGNILKQLRDRTADAGFVFGEVQDSDIGSQYLTDVSLVVVAPLAANAQLQSGTWTAVASLPWIASTIDCPFEAIGSAIFTSMGHTPPKVVVADDGATKIDLIRAGVGAALMEQSEGEEAAASGGVALWNPDGIRCPLSFAWLKQREKEPLLDAMRTAVEQIWQTSERAPSILAQQLR
jgi:DNA-binding transcriptional LysR family regulator